MEATLLGNVLVTAKIENAYDIERRKHGALPADQVRTIEVTDALADAGASELMLPKRLITQLGLRHYRTRNARGIGETVPMPMYATVRLTIQGRECALDAGEMADELPAMTNSLGSAGFRRRCEGPAPDRQSPERGRTYH